MDINKIYQGDCLEVLKTFPDEWVNCVVTSPPYWGLRDYGVDGQLGLEKTPEEYVDKMVQIFREIKRVLKKDGTVWLNLGDSYAGSGKAHGQKPEHKNCGRIKQKRDYDVPMPTPSKEIGMKPKDLIGIPWHVAFALQKDGWYLRQDIIWHKPNPMPESVTDRCTKAHEYIFLLTKNAKYYYDHEAIMEEATGFDNRKDTKIKGSPKYENSTQTVSRVGGERWPNKMKNLEREDPNTMHKNRAEGLADEEYPARNKRSVWTVNTKPFSEAHFAVYPPKLIKPCILAGCPKDGLVLDPFGGSGTTAVVSRKLERNYAIVELNPDYIKIAENRIYNELGMYL